MTDACRGVAALRLVDVSHDQVLVFAIPVHGGWYVPTTLFGAVAIGWRGARQPGRRVATRTKTSS